jgi:hypothetical protein
MSVLSVAGARLCVLLAVISVPLLSACEPAETPPAVPGESERGSDNPAPPAAAPTDPANTELPEGSTGLGGQREEDAKKQ